MRRIMSPAEIEKKRKRNQLIIGIVLIITLFFSVFGIAFSRFGGRKESNLKSIEYNNVKFSKDINDYWRFTKDNKDYVVRYNPEEIKDINFFSYLTIGKYLDQPLYISGKNREAQIEIGTNLLQNKQILRLQPACQPEGCTKDLPTINCKNNNAIVFKENFEYEDENIEVNGKKAKVKKKKITPETIYEKDNCVYIVASQENQTRYADAFLFKILGIN